MNKLLIATAIVAVASAVGATSSTVDSSATTPNLPNLCEFSNVSNGSMSWNESNNVFDNIVAPTLTMKVRDVTGVTVTTNKSLYNSTDSATADILSSVVYTGSTAVPQSNLRSLTATVGVADFVVNAFDDPQYFDMTLNHTAVPSSTFVAKDLTTYTLTHTITCAY